MAHGKCAIYFDLISQPCRAVLLFIRCNGLDVEERAIPLRKGAQKSPEYLNVNPLGKVPCLQEDDEFSLPESSAIMKYLAAKYRVPDHWYPGDLRKRARVDAALDWHHTTIRRGCTAQVWHRLLAPPSGRVEAVAKEGEGVLNKALQDLEAFWLGATPYVAGEEMSIADLSIVCELEQLQLLVGAPEGPSMEQQLQGFARVQQWMRRVREDLDPTYSEVHAMLGKAAQGAARRKLKSQPESKL